ncbi:MAG: prepilin-type N-terminal cleavage/methylation domain-containing protein [Elusimicrobiaceae bacterium]|nr:prepilin-type N-terminal cleavage/methylation domain-containing protein [Elusimicrobiaceae bacterium]
MKKGFTLIELLIVVVLVGVLMAIAAPKFYVALERGRSAEGLNYIHQVATDLNAYYIAHGEYPTGSSDLNPYLSGEYSKQYPLLKYFKRSSGKGNKWLKVVSTSGTAPQGTPQGNKMWIILYRPGFYTLYGFLHNGNLTGITCGQHTNVDATQKEKEADRYCAAIGFERYGETHKWLLTITDKFFTDFCNETADC